MNRRKILLVDDSAIIVEALKVKLEDSGYEVVTASDGEEALSVVVATSPDMVILDINMPGIDGFEVCRRLRAAPATEDLPVVILSSRGDVMDRLTGFRAGADDYLVKESDITDLSRRIKLIFQIREQQP